MVASIYTKWKRRMAGAHMLSCCFRLLPNPFLLWDCLFMLWLTEKYSFGCDQGLASDVLPNKAHKQRDATAYYYFNWLILFTFVKPEKRPVLGLAENAWHNTRQASIFIFLFLSYRPFLKLQISSCLIIIQSQNLILSALKLDQQADHAFQMT